MYDEALSIAGLANTLERRETSNDSTTRGSASSSSGTQPGNTPSNNLVVQQVVQQIRQRQGDLQQQLWQRLSQDSVTLPDCLEVVTALRRLNAIHLEAHKKGQSATQLEATHARLEAQLQMDFLQARDVWLDARDGTTQTPSVTGGPDDLLDVMERFRTRLFEVATQFQAIFHAKESTSTNTTALLSSVALLRLWMSRRIEGFLQMLTARVATLPDTSAVRDALEAALFLATSLGRLGADFSARLPPIFEPVIVQLVASFWQQGVQQLEETMVVCREAGVATPLTGSAPLSSDDSDAATAPWDALRPPRKLLETPPLARFVNSLLTGYNELRRCLLPGTVYALELRLQSVLDDVQTSLRTHERAVHLPGIMGASGLRPAARHYQTLWSELVVPYAWASFYAAVGNEVQSAQYGETVQAYGRTEVVEEEVETEKTDHRAQQKDPQDHDQEGEGNEMGITPDNTAASTLDETEE
jgi:hypothetical protein